MWSVWILLRRYIVFQTKCIAICIIIFIPTVVLNASILIFMIKDRISRSEHSISMDLVMNLVVTDLVLGLFTQPLTAIEFSMIATGKASCKISVISNPISFYLAIVSFTTLTLLAMDRYIKFLHPFRHIWFSRKSVTFTAITFAWIIPLWPVLITTISHSMNVMDEFILYYGATFVTINIFCNVRIGHLIKKQRKRIRDEQLRFQRIEAHKKEASLAILGILLFVSSVLCYLPVICLSAFAMETNRGPKRTIGYLTYWAWTISCLSPLMNPIVKCYMLSNLRKAIVRLYAKCFHREENSVEVLQTNAVLFG